MLVIYFVLLWYIVIYKTKENNYFFLLYWDKFAVYEPKKNMCGIFLFYGKSTFHISEFSFVNVWFIDNAEYTVKYVYLVR